MKKSPVVYASFVSTMWKERNPFVMLLKELLRMLKVVANLRNNLRTSNQRIQQLEKQSNKLQSLISESQTGRRGEKLNIWR